MKNLLFPRGFQIAGWILFIPAIIMGAIIYFQCFQICNIISGIAETIINDAVIIGIALGSIFIVCTKEPCEDEMTRSIRLSALLNALYIYVLLLIAITLLINGVAYLQFTFLNLALLPVISVIIYRLEIHRYNKMSGDEE